MLCKYIITIGDSSCEIPPSDFVNWKDLMHSFDRKEYSGVIRQFNGSFRFCGKTYERIISEYRDKGVYATALITVLGITNNWRWEKKFECPLDFSSISFDGYTVSFFSVDNSASAVIKSNKGTEYEYAMSEMPLNDRPFCYDGIVMENTVSYASVGESIEDSADVKVSIIGIKNHINYFPLAVLKEDLTENKVMIYQDQTDMEKIPVTGPALPGTIYGITSSACLVEAIKPMTIHLDMEIPVRDYAGEIILIKTDKDGNFKEWYAREGSNTVASGNFILSFHGDISFDTGEMLALVQNFNSPFDYYIVRHDGFVFDIKWNDRIDGRTIPYLKPYVLLERLLTSMNGGAEKFTGKIINEKPDDYQIGEKAIRDGYDWRLDSTILVPAECIRGIDKAKAYSSFTKFCNWMEAVFGFVYYVEDDSVCFVHRSKLYSGKICKKIKYITNFEYRVDDSRLYSQVNIGFEPKDYDSINGRYEFNKQAVYMTGIRNTDKKLELISGYRGDCYGFEFLAEKFGRDSEDTDCDNDMWCVLVEEFMNDQNKTAYRVDRSASLKGNHTDSMFNYYFSVPFLIQVNKGFLASFSNQLQYSSSLANNNIAIDGKALNDSYSLDDSLFTIGILSFESNDIDVVGIFNDLIEVRYKNLILSGYIRSVVVNISCTETAKYELIVKDIRDA